MMDLNDVTRTATIELTRDAWMHVRAAAGRLPYSRSISVPALQGAWKALSAALKATPHGARRMRLTLTLGQHVALLDAAQGGLLPSSRHLEPASVRAYARLVHEAYPA